MKPFNINIRCGNLEVLAEITDSMVQDYGCRVKYDGVTGLVDLVGEAYCRDVVAEVVKDRVQPHFRRSAP